MGLFPESMGEQGDGYTRCVGVEIIVGNARYPQSLATFAGAAEQAGASVTKRRFRAGLRNAGSKPVPGEVRLMANIK
jgi:hypothetical protein